MSKQYYTCEICGSNLDPDENCSICNAKGLKPNNHFIYPKSCDKTIHHIIKNDDITLTDEEDYRHTKLTHKITKM